MERCGLLSLVHRSSDLRVLEAQRINSARSAHGTAPRPPHICGRAPSNMRKSDEECMPSPPSAVLRRALRKQQFIAWGTGDPRLLYEGGEVERVSGRQQHEW